MNPNEFTIYITVRSVEQLPTTDDYSGSLPANLILVKATQRPHHEMKWRGGRPMSGDASLFFVVLAGCAPTPGEVLAVKISQHVASAPVVEEQTGNAGLDVEGLKVSDPSKAFPAALGGVVEEID